MKLGDIGSKAGSGNTNKSGGLTLQDLTKMSNDEWIRRKKEEEELQQRIKDQNSFFKSGDSDLGRGLGASTGDFLLDIGQGFFRTLEGVADWAQYRLADVDEFLGLDESVEWLRKNAQFDSTGSLFGTNENAQETLFGNQWREDINKSSYLGGMSDQIGEGIGNIGAMAAMAAVGNAGLGAAGVGVTETGALTTGGKLFTSGLTSYTSAYGTARSEAYKNGASDDEANKYAMINGFAEALSEQFFDSMPGIQSAGLADKISFKGALADKLKSSFGTNVGKTFLKLAGGLEEGSEEVISNALVALGSDLMHSIDKNYNYGREDLAGDYLKDVINAAFTQDSFNAFVSAGLTSVLLGGAEGFITTAQQNQVINAFAKDNNMSFKEAKSLLSGELLEESKKAVKNDKNVELDSEIELEDRARERILNYMRAHEGQNIESRVEDLVKQEEKNTGVTFTDEQRLQVANKIRNQLVEEVNERDKHTSFRLDQEPTDKRDKALYESFKKSANNTREAHNLYKMFTELHKQNSKARYELVNNEQLVEMGYLEKQGDKYGRTINGKFVEETPNGINLGNKILINAEGLNALEATTWHEIAHSIKDTSPEGYNELKGIIHEVFGEDDYKNYEQKYKTLYGDVELLEDEYINDKLGEMLNNDTFVDRITENQNLLQQLIEQIKKFIKYMTSSKEQKQMMQLQEKLEKRYTELYKEAKFKKGDASFSLDSQGKELSQEQQGNINKFTDNGILMSYVRNPQSNANQYKEHYKNVGLDFGQDIEPSGEYMSMDTLEGKNKIDGYEYGYINFKKPLVIDNPDTTSNGWKKDLSNMYNGLTGKKLSNAIMQDGYDAVISRDNNGNVVEVVNLNGSKVNNQAKYSLSTDNQGRELSKEQQTYFKDSKVRDEEGHLQAVYHGTTKPGFTIFKPSTADSSTFGKYKFNDYDVNYFTASKDTARGYTDIGVEENGNIYETYLNITNPYVVDNVSTADVKSWRNIKDNNVRQYETEYYDKFESKWNTDKDITKNLDKINADLFPFGCELRLNDGYYELYRVAENDGWGEQLLLYVGENDNTNELFNEGLKEAVYGDSFDDYKYTSDGLVRWIIAQNADGQKYDGIIIPNITDNGTKGSIFGEPTTDYVTFNSNQIKNVDNTNPTSNPDIRYSLSADGLKNLANELGESYSMLESNLTGRDRQGIKRYLENYTNIVDKYLADNNIKVEPAYKDIEFTRVRTPELQQFVKDNELTIEKLANDQELQDKYFDLWFGDANEEKFTKQWRDLLDFVKENPREGEIPRPLRAIQREMQQIRDGETQEIDESATKSKKLDAAIDNGYDFWIEDQITPLFEKIDYDPDEVMEEAKANHGTTNSYAVGAYMTTDGSLLNFSDGGYRDDHRTISVFNLDMNEFMDYGAIRMKPEGNGFEMAVEPTADQYSRLEDYIDNYLKANNSSGIYVDFDIPGTNNYNSASYNINTPTSKIINDIKEYWRTGELPKQSEYADFYYSLSKTNEAPVRTQGTYTEDITENRPFRGTQEEQNLPFYEANEPLDRMEAKRAKLADKRISKMIEKQTYKSVKDATKIANDYIGFDAQEKKEFRDSIKRLASKPKETLIKAKSYNQVKDIVSRYANRDTTFVSEELKEAQKDIRHTQLIVSDELKKGITDWSAFRKQSGLNIKTGQKSNVDVVYQELLDSYPGMLDATLTNYADQIQALSDFVKRDNKYVEHYQLDDNTITQITNRVFESMQKDALTQQELKAIEDDINKKIERRTREVVQNELLEDMGITIDDISQGNDISSVAIQRTDPKRLNEKVFGREIGQKINDATVNFVGRQEAERTRFLNKERSEIEDLGIKARSKESAAVQKYGEKEYVNDKGELVKYTEQDLMNEFKDRATQERIKHAAQVLREKYDTYIDRINDVLTEMGYDAIPKRQDYFMHFIELEDKFSKWGIPYSKENLNAEELSTDINGLTDQFKPGKNFFASALQRKGIKTTYDAITGIDRYLEGASNLIYHTESIQRYRTLSKLIRDTFGQTHGAEDIDMMTEEEAAQRIQDIYDNKLTRYAAWLDEQANALAGKKGAIDRSMERFMGRKAYTFLNALKSQVGSNMTGFNVRSSLTNFASAIQGAAKTEKLSLLEGTAFALKNFRNESTDLINKSDFLTRRFGSDSISKKAWQKISAAGQIFMSASDRFTSLQIWGGKYYEGINHGLTQEAAIKQADDFAARIMGDRSKGQTAEIFNSKTLGLLTQFQLEVNNQWSSMVHDNIMQYKENPGARSAMKIVSQLGQLYAASYFFNSLMKALTGSDVMFDPIEILKGIFAPPDDEEEEINYEERAREAVGKIIDQLPMASIFTGGRIPLSEAFTGVGTLAKYATGQKDQWGNAYTTEDVKDDLIASAFYFLLPTGYGQIKKAAQGLGQYGQVLPEPIEKAMDIYHNDNLPIAGNYTKAGKLKYEADTSLEGKIQSALFGRNASKNAQEYYEKGYQPLSESKVNEALSANLPISEYREIDSDIAEAKRLAKEKGESQQEAQYDYIYNLPLSMEQKNSLLNARLGTGTETKDKNGYIKYTDGSKTYWYDPENDVVYNSKYREMSNISVDDLTKYSNLKDLTDYGQYESLDEFNYANQNPTKYKALKQIATYSKYTEYKDDIAAIKDNYNDGSTAGKNAAKQAVFEYINALPLNQYQKLMLQKMAGGYSIKNYKRDVQNYINSLDLSAEDKMQIDSELF